MSHLCERSSAPLALAACSCIFLWHLHQRQVELSSEVSFENTPTGAARSASTRLTSDVVGNLSSGMALQNSRKSPRSTLHPSPCKYSRSSDQPCNHRSTQCLPSDPSLPTMSCLCCYAFFSEMPFVTSGELWGFQLWWPPLSCLARLDLHLQSKGLTWWK